MLLVRLNFMVSCVFNNTKLMLISLWKFHKSMSFKAES